MVSGNGDLFAVGDIHGCYEQLVALMEKIPIDHTKDILVFLGDYIDRGNKSYEVVQYLTHLREQHDNIVFLKGNHEEMLEKYLTGPDKHTYIANGGRPTLESYMARTRPGSRPIPNTHMEFYNSLELYYETADYIFVHAGLRDGVPLYEQDAEDLLWIREDFVRSEYDFGKCIVFGHTPFPEPMIMKNKIGIDTGAVYGNQLSCIRLPRMEFYSV